MQVIKAEAGTDYKCCSDCRTIMQFEYADIKDNSYVICPVCYENIYLTSVVYDELAQYHLNSLTKKIKVQLQELSEFSLAHTLSTDFKELLSVISNVTELKFSEVE